jgi:GNAT superfamily N-acetyltransferase
MYHLRPASSADLPALQHLIADSVRGLSIGYYSAEEIEASLRHVFGVDTQLLADRTYFVIESEDSIVAAGGWSGRRTLFGGDQHKSGVDERLDPATEPARIRAFFVHPAHARRGLARQLFARCATEAAEAGFRRLALAATLPGVALYEALGFVAHDPIDVPMPGGLVLRCIHMERTLDGV